MERNGRPFGLTVFVIQVERDLMTSPYQADANAGGVTGAHRLNELEFIRGEIFANVWQTDEVVRIDPATGNVRGVIDFSGLLGPQDRNANTDVLNGIAYDAQGDRLFVTGKRWPKLFEIKVVKKP